MSHFVRSFHRFQHPRENKHLSRRSDNEPSTHLPWNGLIVFKALIPNLRSRTTAAMISKKFFQSANFLYATYAISIGDDCRFEIIEIDYNILVFCIKMKYCIIEYLDKSTNEENFIIKCSALQKKNVWKDLQSAKIAGSFSVTSVTRRMSDKSITASFIRCVFPAFHLAS